MLTEDTSFCFSHLAMTFNFMVSIRTFYSDNKHKRNGKVSERGQAYYRDVSAIKMI